MRDRAAAIPENSHSIFTGAIAFLLLSPRSRTGDTFRFPQKRPACRPDRLLKQCLSALLAPERDENQSVQSDDTHILDRRQTSAGKGRNDRPAGPRQKYHLTDALRIPIQRVPLWYRFHWPTLSAPSYRRQHRPGVILTHPIVTVTRMVSHQFRRRLLVITIGGMALHRRQRATSSNLHRQQQKSNDQQSFSLWRPSLDRKNRWLQD